MAEALLLPALHQADLVYPAVVVAAAAAGVVAAAAAFVVVAAGDAAAFHQAAVVPFHLRSEPGRPRADTHFRHGQHTREEGNSGHSLFAMAAS